MLRNLITEANGKIRGLCYSQDSKEAVIKQAEDSLGPLHTWMEGKKWVMGDHFTYLDLAVFEGEEFLDALTEGHFFVKFPNFKTHMNNVRNLDEIKAYRSGPRWDKNLTFNAGMAKINCHGRDY